MPVILGGNTGIYLASLTPSVDPDAQAFITAAAITDPTQQAAINTLVVDLKGYSIWTKMKALYPFVGGTASTHKFNLKDPRDLDAAFRLRFFGDVTHSSNGVKGGGVNGYANTYLIPSTSLTNNSLNVSVYSRNAGQSNSTEIGCSTSGFLPIIGLTARNIFDNTQFDGYDFSAHRITASETDGRGLFLGSITSSTSQKLYKNGVLKTTQTAAQTQTQPTVQPIYILARNDSGSPSGYSSRNLAFSSIGDGLTDTEAANFYTAVQTFQTTIGRSIGTQTVSDADAQAFVTNAGIVDQVEANAINNLVIGMKADGLWTKMKAIYPFVGGTATTNKFNLKNPLDTNAAFRASFVGGITHSSTGVKGNAINGYFDTWIIPSDLFTSTSGGSMFCYIRNNTQTGVDLGAFQAGLNYRFQLGARNTSDQIVGSALANNFIQETNTDSRGFWGVTRPPSSSTYHLIKNTTSSSSTDAYVEPIAYLKGLALGIDLTSQIAYSDHELSFVCVADGLTTTEAQTLRTINLTFQTALNRNI
jgi:hypothetical protein